MVFGCREVESVVSNMVCVGRAGRVGGRNDSTGGFQPLLAGSANAAVYGSGTYFARDASYSHTYALGCLVVWLFGYLLLFVVISFFAKGCASDRSTEFILRSSITEYIYFLLHAHMCRYAHQLDTGQRQMLVADVNVGRSTRGRRDMKVTPLPFFPLKITPKIAI